MYGIYLDAYIAFLGLLSLFMIANTFVPRKKDEYATRKDYAPRVLVIVPCKGADIDLAGNLDAVKRQRYKNYNVVAVVESNSDIALEAIGESHTKFILADPKYRGSGKVKNIASAIAKFRDYSIYVILDSDVLVGSMWLEQLIAPLADKSVGLSTAYPVFKAIGGFWSKVKHAWGFVGNGMMESKSTRFGWGGSLAFRKDLLSGSDFSLFAGSVSDDIALTRIAKGKGLKIAYVPEANPIVTCNDNFVQFVEWSNRQSALSVAGNRKVLYYGIVFYSAGILLLVSAIALAVFVNAVFLLFIVPSVLGAAKLYLRSKGQTYMLGIYFIMNFIYLLNLLRAGQMRTIRWRGRVYDITSIRKNRK